MSIAEMTDHELLIAAMNSTLAVETQSYSVDDLFRDGELWDEVERRGLGKTAELQEMAKCLQKTTLSFVAGLITTKNLNDCFRNAVVQDLRKKEGEE